MEIKLKRGGEDLAPIEKILYTRGADYSFLHPQPSDELDYHTLDNINEAARRILKAVVRQEQVYVQVDSDCDGYTSAALLLNYLHSFAPSTIERNWHYGLHKAKLHGIATQAIPEGTTLVIAPDSSSNESDIHQRLCEAGISVVVLDHHEFDLGSNEGGQGAIIVNSQQESYGNHYLSGVGVVYKCCQAIDGLRNRSGDCSFFLDLVALGLTGDMMDMRNAETNYYINEGFQHIENPFFLSLAEKNEFSMKGKFNPHSVAWFIVPFINAVTRIGEDADKLLVFESMLDWKANQLIPSDKRGAKGTEELRVIQAVRHAGNIKRHQDEEKKKLLDEMYSKIEKYHLADEPMIIIQNKGVQDDDPIRGITGLVANAIMSTYVKPTLILNEIYNESTGETIWSGSGRGFYTAGISNWRDYIANTGCAIFAQGHAMAFGVAFDGAGLERFKDKIRDDFGTTKFDKIYEVDFIWTPSSNFDEIIVDIGRYKDVWGQGVPEPIVAIEHIKITDPIQINLLQKGTLRIDLKPHKTSIIKFGSTVEEYQNLLGKTITVIGTCDINDWSGEEYPQIKLVDYFFETVSAWDF